jgi:hypothetical protein
MKSVVTTTWQEILQNLQSADRSAHIHLHSILFYPCHRQHLAISLNMSMENLWPSTHLYIAARTMAIEANRHNRHTIRCRRKADLGTANGPPLSAEMLAPHRRPWIQRINNQLLTKIPGPINRVAELCVMQSWWHHPHGHRRMACCAGTPAARSWTERDLAPADESDLDEMW